jgi:ATP/maltotriose-dependent transcriptional regulator MalT
LFVERAGDVAPDFTLDPENVAVIAEIVRRLDGLPLAIELAAARLGILSPQGLLTRLDPRLPVLVGGLRDLPDRLRTMRSAIAWSYDLLPVDEQGLLARLSVFADTIPLTAAATVCGDGDELATLEQLAHLTEHSLLVRDEDRQDEPRFRLLQTIREFARERLRENGDEIEVMTRLTEWCLELAESAATTREKSTVTPETLARLDIERQTLREVLVWLETHDQPEWFVRLAAALSWYWLQRSHRREGRRWLEAAVAQAEASGLKTHAVARALDGAAVLAFSQGDHDLAHAATSKALALSTEREDLWGIAGAWNLLGAIARARGDCAEAESCFTTAREHFAALGDPGWIALATLNLGTIAFFQGKTAQALELMEDARRRYEALDDAYGQAIAWSDLGRTLGDDGELAAAQMAFARSLVQWRRVGTREGMIDWLTRVASLVAYQGRPLDALRWFSAAETVRLQLGYVFDQPERERQRGALERARLSLGEERVAAAWDAGRALPLYEAIDEAGRTLAALRSPQPISTSADTAPGGMTPREFEVLRLLVEGRSDRQIGEALFISHRTVMRHVENILGKLQVESRTAAATLALRQGYV